MTTSPFLVSARALANDISERAHDFEAERKMPDDLVEAIRDAGLFHLMAPSALGGHECEPATIVDVVEEISRADGSAGWNVFVGQGTAFTAWLDPVVAKEIVADRPAFLLSGSLAPIGRGRPDGGDLMVDGRWPFSSGCSHADWFANGVMVMDGDGPRLTPEGRPDWRLAFMPASDIEIIDSWHVAGLRGTGSHDVTVHAARVPYERTAMPFYESARFDGPLFRLPFPTLICAMIAGFPLGVARRALDEFRTLAATKPHTVPGPPMAHDSHVEVSVAQAEASLRAARAYVHDAIGDAWGTVVRGDDVTYAQRANAVMAVLHAARTARTVVGEMYSLSGGSAIYDRSPMQRCARDIEAGTQHIFLGFGQWEASGRVLFGLDPGTPRL